MRIGLGDLFAGEVTEHFGSPVWTISQGPQVLLDAQATPVADGLMINWDTREDAFRPGVADAMFAHHLAELERLANDESAWEALDSAAVTPEQRSVRDAVNGVDRRPSGDALHDGFFRRAAGATGRARGVQELATATSPTGSCASRCSPSRPPCTSPACGAATASR